MEAKDDGEAGVKKIRKGYAGDISTLAGFQIIPGPLVHALQQTPVIRWIGN
jgi:hypothetical protein